MNEAMPSGDWVHLGYLGAVAAASISFTMLLMLLFLIYPGLPPFTYDERLFLMLIMVPIFGVVALVTALPPFLAALKIAKLIGTNAAWYYAVSGAVTGLILTPVALIITTRPYWLFWDAMLTYFPRVALFFILIGAVGGLTFWSICGRRCLPAKERNQT
jgi:hypothetical protein